MKSLLVALTVLALSTVALAYPGPDSMALYTDADVAGVPSLTLNTTTPFEPITLYLCISNPSLDGVSGWEGIVAWTGSLTAPSWTLNDGLDVDSINDTPTQESFQVGIGEAPLALTPNTNGNVVLATFEAFVVQPTDEIEFFIKGVPGSTSFPGPTPGYASPIDAGTLLASVNLAGDPTLPVFCINHDCGVVGNEDMTFSSVKSLYR